MLKLLLSILPTVLLAVFSQLVMKWRVNHLFEAANTHNLDFFHRLIKYFSDPLLLAAYVSTFSGSIAWMLVVEKFDISTAFPMYVGLTFMLVILVGCLTLDEPINNYKVISVSLIFLGIVIGSYGK